MEYKIKYTGKNKTYAPKICHILTAVISLLRFLDSEALAPSSITTESISAYRIVRSIPGTINAMNPNEMNIPATNWVVS